MEVKTITLGKKVVRRTKEAQNYYQELLQKTDSVEDKALLRDMLLHEEMNEWILRNMYNL